jgi:hypothetical protein
MKDIDNYTDTELLDALQSTTKGYGDGWVLRESSNGRGMRLHEAGSEMPLSEGEAVEDVRQAIKNYLKKAQ